jgi:putative ABC transport system permease protein
MDWRFFLFAFAVSLAAGMLFGIAPALQISGPNLNGALVEVPRGGTPGRSVRLLRNSLVMLQLALAVVVMIGSGLLVRSFVRLRAADPGFRPAGLLTFRLPTAGGRNASPERRSAYFTQAAERIAALPGVRSVGLVDSLPLRGLGTGLVFSVEGHAPLPADQRPVALVRFANASYFRTMGIPLLAGREFTAADTRQTPNVMIVNRTVARRFWPAGSPVGGRIAASEANERLAEIVGVVGDVKSERIEGDDWPTVYYPYTQAAPSSIAMVVKTAGRPMDLFSAAAREIHQMDPDQALADVLTMDEVVDRAIASSRFNTVVLGVFALIAFVLASVGLYGVIAYDVSQRTGEIGVRLALGAQKGDIMRLILGQGAKLALGGIAMGLAAAFGLTRLMTTMLFGIPAADVQTFGLIALALGAVALAASYLPARRAVTLDPVIALRHE